MRFAELARYLEKLEKTSSRNELTAILAEVLNRASEEEVDKLCYLLLGELVPSYRGLEFQIAEKMMLHVLSVAYKKSAAQVAGLYKIKGDLGDTAYELAPDGTRGVKLTVSGVYQKLYEVAEESGEGSRERKVRGLADLLGSLDRLSAKFVVRIPSGKLRLGFSEATMLDALSLMVKGDKSARPAIERAFNIGADIGAIAGRVKNGGLGALAGIKATPGIPIRPSLAERLSKPEEIIQKAGPEEVAVEEKLDGFRTQVHVWLERGKKRTALFSRNLENTTMMFPEITAAAETLRVKSVILDGETIGYNAKTGKFAPFQETVQRKRKHGIAEFARKIPLNIFVFDILYLDGKSLLELAFRKRREILERILSGRSAGAIQRATQRVTRDPKAVADDLGASVAKGLEGIVVKNLDAPYQAGGRGFHWIKLKATTAALEQLRAGKAAGLPDTIDCIVMGAYRGRGRRTRFGVGGLLLGVSGGDGRYYTISRLGTGLSDEQFREANRRIRRLSSPEQPKEYIVEKEITPDFWANPGLVVEILADEITYSPRHTAGRKRRGPPVGRAGAAKAGRAAQSGEPRPAGRGYSLRFPRLVRFRDDKGPEDATTTGEIIKMYRQQNN